MADQELKVEIIGREIIKPSSPTPSDLRIFNLSCFDRIIAGVYTSLVLFYPNNNILTSDQTSIHLKKSLSEALTLFYPLAGKIKDNTVIECRDDGATYVEAKFNGLLSTFLDQEHKDEALIKRFLPAAMESPEAGTWPLLLVQATFFDCGGVAIGFCMSHKVGDAATLSIFLKTWAGTGIPDFEAASYYRTGDHTFSYEPTGSSAVVNRVEDGVVKRCLFDKSKIEALKAKFASDSVKQPTRVEVVTALILRCLMEANSRSTSATPVEPRYFLTTQAVNLRKRLEPSLPDNAVGNFVWLSALQVENDLYDSSTSVEALECQLQDFVAKLRQKLKDFTENKAKRDAAAGLQAVVEAFRDVELFTSDGAEWIAFSSWCNFEFYEVDLGLGKPSCVTIPSYTYENLIYMMDTRDGDGVEIVLTLSKEKNALFENRLQDILSLASLN